MSIWGVSVTASGFTSCLLFILMASLSPEKSEAGSLDQLTDLTGKVHTIVTLKGRDNFTSEYRYDVSVKNQSPDALIGDSLLIVLDRITNLAGEERQSLNNDTILSRFEVLGEDGRTEDGKPFFRLPAANGPDLLPQADSRPATVRIRNKEYLAVFTPSFKVYGLKRPPLTEPKAAESAATPTPSAPPTPAAANRQAVDKLIQLLIKKGVLTEEEWRKANQP